MENENVSQQFKTNQNILKILSCIENVNIKDQWKFHVYTFICFRITKKNQNRFC